jgi:hypothetical protein
MEPVVKAILDVVVWTWSPASRKLVDRCLINLSGGRLQYVYDAGEYSKCWCLDKVTSIKQSAPRCTKRPTTTTTLPPARGLDGTAADHRELTSSRFVIPCRRQLNMSAESGHQLSGRCEGLSLLHHIGAEDSCFRFPAFTARVRCFRRYLEATVWF